MEDVTSSTDLLTASGFTIPDTGLIRGRAKLRLVGEGCDEHTSPTGGNPPCTDTRRRLRREVTHNTLSGNGYATRDHNIIPKKELWR
jgi:hypothetical protein